MDRKQMRKKMVIVLFFTILAILACVVYWLASSGRVNLKKVSSNVAEEVTDSLQKSVTSEDEVPIEDIYNGDRLVVYVSMGVSPEDMDSYAEYFGGIISEDSSPENYCYIIALKETIPAENKPYFLEEVKNHIGIEEVYFTD